MSEPWTAPPSRERVRPASSPARDADRRGGAHPDARIARTAHEESFESGPEWERPRRVEAYPALRARVGLDAIPKPALAFAGLLVAALILFILPGKLLGPSASDASPSPSPSISESPSPSPTAVPTPSPVTYVVASGDTLLKIATKFGVSMSALMAANPAIKDPDKLQVGQRLVIPAADTTPLLDGGSASPSVVASP